MITFGFIGTGNMGGALARAVCKAEGSDRVCLSNRTAEKAEKLGRELACKAASAAFVAANCEYIFLGVKPQTMPALAAELLPVLEKRKAAGERFILVTMAAGLSMQSVSAMFGGGTGVIRIMPNTPVSVGEGMILYTANSLVKERELAVFASALKEAGRTDFLDESEIDAASAVSGCGPAFMFMFMKAMSDAGEKLGLSGEKASLYAQQTMLGAAKLALESGQDPENLKIAVCSPGGTTIEGVKSFENAGLADMVQNAVSASYLRTLELAGKKAENKR